MKPSSKLRRRLRPSYDAEETKLFTVTRVRLVVCLAIYGGMLGGGALLVNLLSRTKFPQTPEHLSVESTVFMSGGAALVCALLSGLIGVIISKYGEQERSHNILVWLALGFLFGVFSPILTGASIPISGVLMSLNQGVLSAGDLPIQLIEGLLHAPSFAFTHGVFGLFTGLLAGTLFGVGAAAIDSTNYLSHRLISTYVPYVIAVSLGILFYSIAAFGPPETLAKLG